MWLLFRRISGRIGTLEMAKIVTRSLKCLEFRSQCKSGCWRVQRWGSIIPIWSVLSGYLLVDFGLLLFRLLFKEPGHSQACKIRKQASEVYTGCLQCFQLWRWPFLWGFHFLNFLALLVLAIKALKIQAHIHEDGKDLWHKKHGTNFPEDILNILLWDFLLALRFVLWPEGPQFPYIVSICFRGCVCLFLSLFR